MIKLNKFKIVKGNFPVLIAENAISKRDCLYLIKEIQNSKNFDDIIMGGRSRINKGSKILLIFLKIQKIHQSYLISLIILIFIKK